MAHNNTYQPRRMSRMRSWVRLPNAPGVPLPPALAGDEVRFPEGLVRRFVEAHTRPGGVVLDPFAGYGTTLAVAEALGREGTAALLGAPAAARPAQALAPETSARTAPARIAGA
jgi:hypothetical protein